MKKLLALISESYHEFKHVSTITTCAMFGAMSIVLSQVASIKVTPNLKIGFSALPNELVDYLFGPVVGSLFGGGMDILKYVLKPDGAFVPGLTFNAMLAAFIYGMFLYKRPLSLRRMLAAKFVVALFCNIILGTYWLSLINGKGYLAILPARTFKNLIQWPVDSLIFFLVAKALEQAKVFRLIRQNR
jgi:ECF transporter S component (folate family)